jgi:hypothetical protein
MDYKQHCPNPLCGQSDYMFLRLDNVFRCSDCGLSLPEPSFRAFQALQEAHALLAKQYELCLKRDPTNVVVGLAACIATLDQAAGMADEYRDRCNGTVRVVGAEGGY